MIHSITVTNPYEESLKLELRNPEASQGIAVLNVDGLGPAKATINETVVSTMDGVLFNSARVGARNIVLTLAFVGHDIETIRQTTYKYFPIKRRVELAIETDNRVVATHGYIETNEPSIFSNQEGTTISIFCPDAYLMAAGDYGIVVSRFYEVFPNLEFPFENRSGSGDLTEKVMEFGRVEIYKGKDVHYDGDVSSGMLLQFIALGPASNLTVFNPETGQTLAIDSAKLTTITGSDILSGDEILISTVKGDKYVRLIRVGVEHNIMNALGTNVSWMSLERGVNNIGFSASAGAENLRLNVVYRPLFEGV